MRISLMIDNDLMGIHGWMKLKVISIFFYIRLLFYVFIYFFSKEVERNKKKMMMLVKMFFFCEGERTDKKNDFNG